MGGVCWVRADGKGVVLYWLCWLKLKRFRATNRMIARRSLIVKALRRIIAIPSTDSVSIIRGLNQHDFYFIFTGVVFAPKMSIRPVFSLTVPSNRYNSAYALIPLCCYATAGLWLTWSSAREIGQCRLLMRQIGCRNNSLFDRPR